MSVSGFLPLILLVPGVPWGLQGSAELEECRDGDPHEDGALEGCRGGEG